MLYFHLEGQFVLIKWTVGFSTTVDLKTDVWNTLYNTCLYILKFSENMLKSLNFPD